MHSAPIVMVISVTRIPGRRGFNPAVLARPTHFVPTAGGFAAAVRAGLGWGLGPQTLAERPLAPSIRSGRSVPVRRQKRHRPARVNPTSATSDMGCSAAEAGFDPAEQQITRTPFRKFDTDR
jgi:DNA-binding transcriptional LysR family regulator